MSAIKALALLVCLTVSWVDVAFAIDVESAIPPQTIRDNQLTIGSRTLRLPEGTWNYVAQTKTDVLEAVLRTRLGTRYHVYAMDVKNGRFNHGVELQMLVNSISPTGWVADPCKKEGYLFKDELSGGPKTPECLTVYKRESHLRRPSGDFYPQASQWTAREKIKLPGAVYEVTYTRYAAGEHGMVRVWVPVDHIAGDEAMVAWAKGLPERLRRLFERRENDAFLPPIPSRD